MLQVRVPDTHGDRQHLDASAGLRGVHRRGRVLLDPAIDRDPAAGENRIRRILFGCHHLLRLFVRISHTVLSLRDGWQAILQVSDQYPCATRRALCSLETTNNYWWCPFDLFHVPALLCASLERRLDYCGIALLIMGSFVPWLYYGFYCHYEHKLVYLSVVLVLGAFSIIVSLYDKFSEPQLRPVRAGTSIPFFFFALSEFGMKFNRLNNISCRCVCQLRSIRNHTGNTLW